MSALYTRDGHRKTMRYLSQCSDDYCEANDCTVRALAVACGVSYGVAHKAMKAAGRPARKGASLVTMEDAAESLGFEMTGFGVPSTKNPRAIIPSWRAKTVSTAPRDPMLQRGAFILSVRGHVAAMRDGRVFDWTDGRRHRIRHVYRVTPIPAERQLDEHEEKRTGYAAQRPLFW